MSSAFRRRYVVDERIHVFTFILHVLQSYADRDSVLFARYCYRRLVYRLLILVYIQQEIAYSSVASKYFSLFPSLSLVAERYFHPFDKIRELFKPARHLIKIDVQIVKYVGIRQICYSGSSFI